MQIKIKSYAASSDAGSERTFNEDAYIAMPEIQAFAVADGFGGQGIGDKAATSGLEAVKYFLENGLGDSEVTLPFIYRNYYSSAQNLVLNALLYANQQIFNQNKNQPMNLRGGASIVCGFFEGRNLTVGSVGACTVQLLRNGKLSNITKPRSYKEFRGCTDSVTNWNFPLTALGQFSHIEPEILDIRIEIGDLIVFSSDGIAPFLTESDLAECYLGVINNNSLHNVVSEQNHRLIELAKSNGSNENYAMITVICG